MAKQAKAHNRYSPSDSARWMTCTAALAFCDSLGVSKNDNPSKYAETGTLAHAVLAQRYGADDEDTRDKSDEASEVDESEEIANAVELASQWIDAKTAQMAKAYEKIKTHVEVPLHIKAVGTTGTADHVICASDSVIGGFLCVADYKHGMGIVDAAENSQGGLYVSGALDTFGLRAEWDAGNLRAEVAILQPRRGNFSTFRVTRKWLAKLEDHARMAIAADKAGKGVFAPSEKACWFCPAFGRCEAANKHRQQLTEQDFADYATPGAMSHAQLANAYEQLPFVGRWMQAVRGEAFRVAAMGKLPGWSLVETQGRRKWSNEEKAIEVLEQFVPREKLVSEKLLGITKVAKLLPPKKRKVIDELTFKPQGQPRLERSDNAASDFDGAEIPGE